MLSTAKILVVDDEANIRASLKEILARDGYHVITAESGESALALLPTHEFDLALIDLKLTGIGGIEVLAVLREQSPNTVAIVLTAHASLETAVEALRKGATVEQLHELTYIKAWFIQQMKELVELEEQILRFKGKSLPDDLLARAKRDGFADKYLAKLLSVPETEIRQKRTSLGVVEAWDAVPVSGVENAAYYYSTYNGVDTVSTSNRKNREVQNENRS